MHCINQLNAYHKIISRAKLKRDGGLRHAQTLSSQQTTCFGPYQNREMFSVITALGVIIKF